MGIGKSPEVYPQTRRFICNLSRLPSMSISICVKWKDIRRRREQSIAIANRQKKSFELIQIPCYILTYNKGSELPQMIFYD
jgi:hypothetical protein